MPLALIVCIAALALAPAVAASYECTVYRDGYVHVDHTFSVLALEATVDYVPLLWPVELVTVSDSAGTPLYFEEGAGRLVIHTLGTESVTVSYDTALLTSKEGAAWTVTATFDDDVRLVLPEGTTIVYADPLPVAIDLEENTVAMGAGTIELSYILSSAEPEQEGRSMALPLIAAGAVACLVAAGAVLRYRGKHKFEWAPLESLDPIENRVMAYLASEGSVLESEIRERFDIPKTSSWRMMRRLEEQGLLRVERKNRLNIIHFNKQS